MATVARTTSRQGFDPSTRIALLENDADDHEAFGISLQSSVKDDIKAIREEVDGMKKILVGILVSVATACILLVVNIIAVSGGGS